MIEPEVVLRPVGAAAAPSSGRARNRERKGKVLRTDYGTSFLLAYKSYQELIISCLKSSFSSDSPHVNGSRTRAGGFCWVS